MKKPVKMPKVRAVPVKAGIVAEIALQPPKRSLSPAAIAPADKKRRNISPKALGFNSSKIYSKSRSADVVSIKSTDPDVNLSENSPKAIEVNSSNISPKAIDFNLSNIFPKAIGVNSSKISPKAIEFNSSNISPKAIGVNSSNINPTAIEVNSSKISPKAIEVNSSNTSPKATEFIKLNAEKNTPLKLITWNVNGLQACIRKGFMSFLKTHDPDVLFLQETKISNDLLIVPRTVYPFQYFSHCTKKKGYSGTAVFSKVPPISVRYKIGHPEIDSEGFSGG